MRICLNYSYQEKKLVHFYVSYYYYDGKNVNINDIGLKLLK